MGTKETCLYIHNASSPCGKLAVLPASVGKLSPRGLTGCSCIAGLCVRYVPFVVHSLCCLAATIFPGSHMWKVGVWGDTLLPVPLFYP